MRKMKFQLLLSEQEHEILLILAKNNGISAAGVLRQLLLNASQTQALKYSSKSNEHANET